MQAASWLLVQRAVRDGDMARADALNERYRLGSREICLGTCAEDISPLPEELKDLLERSDSLYRRLARLDAVLFGEDAVPPLGARGQLDVLAQAFGAK
jgi:regulator of CtrA degradation